jgi:hypothetical protein
VERTEKQLRQDQELIPKTAEVAISKSCRFLVGRILDWFYTTCLNMSYLSSGIGSDWMGWASAILLIESGNESLGLAA